MIMNFMMFCSKCARAHMFSMTVATRFDAADRIPFNLCIINYVHVSLTAIFGGRC